MECPHALEPHDCIYCNPDYHDAYWAKCPVCSAGRNSATWHSPVDERRVQCLKCKHTHGNTEPWPY